jgi:hypothetical protein
MYRHDPLADQWDAIGQHILVLRTSHRRVMGLTTSTWISHQRIPLLYSSINHSFILNLMILKRRDLYMQDKQTRDQHMLSILVR